MLDVNPTILIGLGGSGKEIILRVRRRFYEAGFLEQPAWLSCLWIDTAVSTEQLAGITQQDGQPLPFDHVASRTAFRPSEKCDIGLTHAELESVRAPENAAQLKHIFEWFDPAVLKALEDRDLTHGTQQQPQLGRLALFFRAPDVVKKLGDALHALSQPKIIDKLESALNRGVMPRPPNGEQFEVYNECQAFIVGSLAGGTGAGVCVDVAAMLKSARTLFQFETRIAVWGHFLLPQAYFRDPRYENTPRFQPVRSQTYGCAALQEIERMSTSRSGAMKATWLFSSDPGSAPDVRAPVYDTAVLYDGSGADGTALPNISDNYAQIAHLMFEELRFKPTGYPSLPVYGFVASRHKALGEHREVASGSPEAYSMRFAAAGFSRVTFEVQRLRLMAAFTLAAKGLQRWIGEPIPRAAFDPDVPLTADESRLEHLGKCIESRLEQEFNWSVSSERKRWRDLLLIESPCALLTTLRNANEVAEQASFFDPFFKLADKWPAEWKPEDLGARLSKYYFTGPEPRIDAILRDLIDHPPLEGWDADRVGHGYDRPGGLWAVYHALSDSRNNPRRTVVEVALSKCITRLNKRAVVLAANNDRARVKLKSIFETYTKIVVARNNAHDMFWVKGTTLEKLTLDRMNCYFDLQSALLKWLENVEKQKVFEALLAGFEIMMRDSATIVGILNGWRKRTQSVRTLLQNLLNNAAAHPSNAEYGLLQILAQFRALKPDASTIQLRLDVQRDEEKLSSELLTAFDGDATALNESVLSIQDGMLAAWRELLFDPAGKNDKLPPQYIAHVSDLARYAAFERLPFGEQIDYLAALGLAQTGAQDMLKTTHIRDSLQRNEPVLKKLYALSQCRLERRDPRRNPSGSGVDPSLPEFRERIFFAGPAGSMPPAPCESVESSDPFEAVCLRYDYFIPLPSVVCLKQTVKAARPAR